MALPSEVGRDEVGRHSQIVQASIQKVAQNMSRNRPGVPGGYSKIALFFTLNNARFCKKQCFKVQRELKYAL